MHNIAQEREQLVEEMRCYARELLGHTGTTRETIEAIAEKLKELASRGDLWSVEDYAEPDSGEKQARHLIAEDEGNTFALYLNVMRPGKRIPPHNHTTWACVAAVEGAELNHIYRRLDDGSVSGKARLEVDREVNITPGSAVAMMPDDIHSVFIAGDEVIRHLHFYGQALDTLEERVMFDMDAGTYRIMDVGVKTRVAGL